MKLLLIDLDGTSNGAMQAARVHAAAARRAGSHVAVSDDVTDRFEYSRPLLSLRASDEFAAEWLQRFLKTAATTDAGSRIADYSGFDLWQAAELSFRQDLYRAVGFVHRARRALEGVEALDILAVRSRQGLCSESFLQAAAGLQIPARRVFIGSRADSFRSFVSRAASRLTHEFAGGNVRLSSNLDVPAAGGRIVFADFFGPNVHSLAPLHDALSRRGVATSWLSLRAQVTPPALAQGSPVHDLDADLAGAPAVVAKCRADIDRALQQLFDDGSFLESLAIDGIAPDAAFDARLRHVLSHTLHHAARLAAGIDRGLDRLEPSAVVTANDTMMPGRLLAQACRKRDTPLVYLQHGVIPFDPYAAAGAADTLLIWGRVSQRALEALGNRPDQLWMTGSAQYDRIFLERDAQPTSSAARPTVTFMSQPPARGIPIAVYRRTVRAVLEAAKKLSGVRFIVKLHPIEPRQLFLDAAAGHQLEGIEILERVDTTALTRESDVVVTQYSTTGLEALLYRKPLVLINLTGEPERVPYAAAGAALLATDSASLLTCINSALHDDSTRRKLAACREAFEEQMFTARDGSATERCANAIVSIAGGARQMQAAAR